MDLSFGPENGTFRETVRELKAMDVERGHMGAYINTFFEIPSVARRIRVSWRRCSALARASTQLRVYRAATSRRESAASLFTATIRSASKCWSRCSAWRRADSSSASRAFSLRVA